MVQAIVENGVGTAFAAQDERLRSAFASELESVSEKSEVKKESEVRVRVRKALQVQVYQRAGP